MAEKYLDLDGLMAVAQQAPPLEVTHKIPPIPPLKKGGMAEEPVESSSRPRIGVIRDGAFQFYYPENLEALEAAGAEAVTFVAAEPMGSYKVAEIEPVPFAKHSAGGFVLKLRSPSEAESFYGYSLPCPKCGETVLFNTLEDGISCDKCGGLFRVALTLVEPEDPTVSAKPGRFTKKKRST